MNNLFYPELQFDEDRDFTLNWQAAFHASIQSLEEATDKIVEVSQIQSCR